MELSLANKGFPGCCRALEDRAVAKPARSPNLGLGRLEPKPPGRGARGSACLAGPSAIPCAQATADHE